MSRYQINEFFEIQIDPHDLIPLNKCLTIDPKKGLIISPDSLDNKDFAEFYSSCSTIGGSLVCMRKTKEIDTIPIDDAFEYIQQNDRIAQEIKGEVIRCRTEKRKKKGSTTAIVSNCQDIKLVGIEVHASCIGKNDEYVESNVNLNSCFGVKKIKDLTNIEQSKISNKQLLNNTRTDPESDIIVIGNGNGEYQKLKNLNTKITKKLILSTSYVTGTKDRTLTVNYNLGDFIYNKNGQLTCRNESTKKHANLKKEFF